VDSWHFLRAAAGNGEIRKTFAEFPPFQKGASFNLEGVKKDLEATGTTPTDPRS
jgi:hypothetical protein